jgi:hypothetical protein
MKLLGCGSVKQLSRDYINPESLVPDAKSLILSPHP